MKRQIFEYCLEQDHPFLSQRMTKSCDSPIAMCGMNATCGFSSACVPSPFVTQLPEYLLPHLSFEDDSDGDADGSIISSYFRRCVSLGIVPRHVSSLSSSSSSQLNSFNDKMDHLDLSLTLDLRRQFVLT